MLIASGLQYTNGLDPMPGDRVSDRGGRLGTVTDVRSGNLVGISARLQTTPERLRIIREHKSKEKASCLGKSELQPQRIGPLETYCQIK